ncbi:transferrin receptor-like protein [Dinothrombium tinctorium]|uniref:Carboxypeptidase Q n=1 Tax=Dinothrombium tinctorium TaxID=1965070 RepID=A0A3S3PGW6_9ACAR|nr:transferrin receptor-like protein [Dinothrombium tinctorium]RWS15013.1 transferrin receptor-like protein [Dinothrombium tinctorium]
MSIKEVSFLILCLLLCQKATSSCECCSEEISSKATIVNRIINVLTKGNEAGVTYNELEKFVDKFGPRMTGTETLENSIDYMLDLLRRNGLNARTEEVEAPFWIRGEEYAEMTKPWPKKFGVLGIGLSVGTNGANISAPVLVVTSFEELEERRDEVQGKIVVYNFKFKSYGVSVKYRSQGASRASKYGALAVLVKSVTPFSLYTPHTGMLNYDQTVPKIPAACITVEDAELIHRLSKRDNVSVRLFMGAKTLDKPAISRNIIVDIKGWKYPEEVVIVSGHIDSWDVGQGAMDDGGGAFVSWRALAVIHNLGLKPKRTLRAILWTGEEQGLWGAQSYIKVSLTPRHKNEIDNISIAMESDIGTFRPLGLTFSGTNPKSQCIVKHTLELMKAINATELVLGVEGSDIVLFNEYKVPLASLNNDHRTYFYYHHTNADTMLVENSTNLDTCTALWAASSFVFADLNHKLWR